jgi:NAD(P)-dependent dehydrogenase (short-subunit alcohol dehydrogenase family)
LVGAPGDVAAACGVAAVIKAVGDVDILVNNVGIFEIKDAFEIPDDDWQRMFETNVLSGVRLTRGGSREPWRWQCDDAMSAIRFSAHA